MSVVGHKVETYLDIARIDGRREWIVTENMIVTELHATKGWRFTRHRRKAQRVAVLPTYRQRAAVTTTTFERINPLPERAFVELTPEAMEKASMRHKWYRRKKAMDAFRLSLPEENRLS